MRSRSQHHPARGSVGLGRRKERDYTLKEWGGPLRVLGELGGGGRGGRGSYSLIKEMCLAWGHSPRLQGNVQVRAWATVGTLLGWPLVVAEAADALREEEMGAVGEERRLLRGMHMRTSMHCLRLEHCRGMCSRGSPEKALVPGTRARAARHSGFHGFSKGDAATGLGSPAGKRMRELQNNSAHSWPCHHARSGSYHNGCPGQRGSGALTHGELGKELETMEPLEAE